MTITLDFWGKVPVPDGTCEKNHTYACSLGLPRFTEIKRDGQLAIIGGGPSIEREKERIKGFEGDIWAINGALGWCEKNGIEATFCSVDPHERVLDWVGGKKAMLGTQVDPRVIDYFRDKGAETILWNGIGTCTASGLSVPAIRMGYKGISYFGCEGSYSIIGTHAYQNEDREEELIAVVNDKFYLTAPDFFEQAKELSSGILQAEGYIKEYSGGLLRAMVRSKGKYNIVYMSPILRKQIEWKTKLEEATEKELERA